LRERERRKRNGNGIVKALTSQHSISLSSWKDEGPGLIVFGLGVVAQQPSVQTALVPKGPSFWERINLQQLQIIFYSWD